MFKMIHFKKNFRSFKEGDVLEFRPGVNVLVGDQGTGKSTLISILRTLYENSTDAVLKSYSTPSNAYFKEISGIVDVCADEDTKCIAFDFEKESLRVLTYFVEGMVGEQVNSYYDSHGMNNVKMFRIIFDKALERKVNVIMLDEPDSSLSPRNCYGLLVLLDYCANKQKIQVIISAHNPIVIGGCHPKNNEPFWKDVLSLENKTWMTVSEFMLGQLEVHAPG